MAHCHGKNEVEEEGSLIIYCFPPPCLRHLCFYIAAMHEGLTPALLQSRCNELGLKPDVVSIIVECWESKSAQMVSSLLARTITANRLIDLDWSFGVTAATDSCDQVGKTFLQLKLTVDRGDGDGGSGGGGAREVFLEMSLEQFYHFLSSMERCKQILDFIHSN